MAASTSEQPAELTKVDSAISGLSSSPTEEKKMGHRRASSSAAGVYNINDLGYTTHDILFLRLLEFDGATMLIGYRKGGKGFTSCERNTETQLVG